MLSQSDVLMAIAGFVLCGILILFAENFLTRNWNVKSVVYLFASIGSVGVIISGLIYFSTDQEYVRYWFSFCVGFLLEPANHYLEFCKKKAI